jgi:hypothetical protein
MKKSLVRGAVGDATRCGPAARGDSSYDASYHKKRHEKKNYGYMGYLGLSRLLEFLGM